MSKVDLGSSIQIEKTDTGYMFLVECEVCKGTGGVEFEDDTYFIESYGMKVCLACAGRGEYWLHCDDDGNLV